MLTVHYAAFTPDTCSPNTSCIHLYPRVLYNLYPATVSGINAALEVFLRIRARYIYYTTLTKEPDVVSGQHDDI